MRTHRGNSGKLTPLPSIRRTWELGEEDGVTALTL